MKNVLYSAIILFLFSCSHEKRKPVYYMDETTVDLYKEDEYLIPFREENGVKYVRVKVNGAIFEMIFDTGCSSTLISLAEANYLYQKGQLTKDDFIGIAKSQIADGSVIENMVVNLREVIIDDKISCSNVTATISSSINAPLLLGNEILNRLATITIDNENNILKFKLKQQ